MTYHVLLFQLKALLSLPSFGLPPSLYFPHLLSQPRHLLLQLLRPRLRLSLHLLKALLFIIELLILQLQLIHPALNAFNVQFELLLDPNVLPHISFQILNNFFIDLRGSISLSHATRLVTGGSEGIGAFWVAVTTSRAVDEGVELVAGAVLDLLLFRDCKL